MKEIIAAGIAGVLALSILCGTVLKCSQIKKDALQACIEKTGEPLECQATFRGEP